MVDWTTSLSRHLWLAVHNFYGRQGHRILHERQPESWRLCLFWVCHSRRPGGFAEGSARISAPAKKTLRKPQDDVRFSILEKNKGISAQVVRGGVVLVDAAVQQLARVDPIPEKPAVPWFNLKLIPSVKKDAPPDVMQLTSTPMKSELKELHSGAASLKFASSPLDPLGDIPVVAVLAGRYTVDDFTLGYGDVLYDYLAESE